MSNGSPARRGLRAPAISASTSSSALAGSPSASASTSTAPSTSSPLALRRSRAGTSSSTSARAGNGSPLSSPVSGAKIPGSAARIPASTTARIPAPTTARIQAAPTTPSRTRKVSIPQLASTPATSTTPPPPTPPVPATVPPSVPPPRRVYPAGSEPRTPVQATPEMNGVGKRAHDRVLQTPPDTPPHPLPRPVNTQAEELARAQRRVRDLEHQYRLLQAEHSRCAPRAAPRPPVGRTSAGVDTGLLALLRDREALGNAVRSLPRQERMGLLGVFAEACRPSDIQAQIDILEALKGLRTGVLARLDDELCTVVLRFLSRRDLLQLRLVAKRFDRLATDPRVWQPLCRELEARWDGTIDLSNYGLGDDGDWLGLYKSLWKREKHWTNGDVQTLAVLGGHKHYVTSLKLCGETLISASYDDTIRVWHLPHLIRDAKAVPAPTVIPAKSVSSIDYYAPEGVLVTGSHDIGRASVWREVDGEWRVQRILSGHLHGTRAVAINAQWLVSVGSDKAIVVWDWRTGTKVVRFGQQTNVCVGMNLLDNFIITATVDGVIRTFSIAKREMIGQFKISDMAARHPQVAEKLKEVGVGALGMLNWFTAEGRFLACATKDVVIRLAWDWADAEEQAELAEGLESPRAGYFDTSIQSTTAPLTPATPRSRPSLNMSLSSPRPASPRTPQSVSATASGATTPARASGIGPSGLGLSPLSPTAANAIAEDAPPPTTTGTTARFALARWPAVVEMLDVTGTERGTFEAGRVRIVASRRLSSRAGAERRVLVGTEHTDADGHERMRLVPLVGAWDAAGLQGTPKNPMSLALDHDKLVYGCSDGSVVVAGFVTQTTQQSRRKSHKKR